ncbi:solute carrier family 23 protein [Desulfonatronovibrio magnus]|uniref:solute carrier family 23 protein n=1 Tax=Desulfonatronovibrio magnus TaxID=698827 RepID=UPI0005EB8F12|nr:solute carrier family 23 protein [Desulfonatronovibrio magnus]
MKKADSQGSPLTHPNLMYGVNDRPSVWTLAVLGVEHGALLISSLMAAVFFAQALGADAAMTRSLVTVGLLAGGLASILQATSKWGLGSGYFCLHTSSFIYFQASITAAQTGGLALVCGMTATAGFMQVMMSRVFGRLRVLFPPEVAGLVVAMVGLALAPYAVKSLFGLGREETLMELKEVLVGMGTLATIVGLTVWGKNGFKLYSILIGIVFGYVSAYALGILPQEMRNQLGELPLVDLPQIVHPGLAFDPAFILPFFIAALCSSLKLTGDVITCQKINDMGWKRVDMHSVQRGINAEGLGTAAAGLLGGTGLAASSSNIGMSFASGATSRYIGYATGIFFIALAFLPQPAFVLSHMPVPVIGSIIIYAASFMIVTGWSIVMTRMIDSRKTFVVGISLIMGMSVLVTPEIYAPLPDHFKPIFGSSIALTAISGVLLNLLFRIGVGNRAELVLSGVSASGQKIHDFFVDMGGKWGARPGVIRKAGTAAAELHESLIGQELSQGQVRLEAYFDEFKIQVDMDYTGKAIILDHRRPSPEELLTDDTALARLSGFLISQYADQVHLESTENKHKVRMVFDH